MMSKFTKRVLDLCSALLMSFASGPSIEAMRYRTEMGYSDINNLNEKADEINRIAEELGVEINKNDIFKALEKEYFIKELLKHWKDAENYNIDKVAGENLKEPGEEPFERKEDIECVICQGKIRPDEPVMRCTKCKGGYYHIGCAGQWAEQKNECPKCRGNFPKFSPWVILSKEMVATAIIRKQGIVK